jgi:hypothetical protein
MLAAGCALRSQQNEKKQPTVQNFQVNSRSPVQVSHKLYDESGARWCREDAAVNCGNFLADLANLKPPLDQIDLLKIAVTCYRAAADMESDAVVWQLSLHAQGPLSSSH